MTKLFKRVTFKDVKDAEARIASAQKKVFKTMNVFTKAAKDVEKANTELARAIEDSDKKINAFQESIAKARQTKSKAETAVMHNDSLLAKLFEFIPARGE
jgi:septal ring factor EnvC (AmiA/AmiB activator)